MDKKYAKKSKEELKKQLTEEQYRVTAENATEAPFNNEYDSFYEKGIYVDVTTGEPLFLSSNKFNYIYPWKISDLLRHGTKKLVKIYK